MAGIVVQLPFLSRPVCLPVPARLWRPRHTGKIAHARELAELIAARYPDRTVHVVGDAAYVGERLRDVDDREVDGLKGGLRRRRVRARVGNVAVPHMLLLSTATAWGGKGKPRCRRHFPVSVPRPPSRPGRQETDRAAIGSVQRTSGQG